MSSMTREGDILTGTLFPRLLEFLHVGDVKHYLLSEKAITREEYELLRVGQSPRLTTERAVADELVLLLSRKPKGATQLLQALEKSVTGDDPQMAHHQLIQQLRGELDEHSKVSSDGPFSVASHQVQQALSNGTVNGESGVELYLPGSDETIQSPAQKPGASNEPVPLVQYHPYLDSQEKERERLRVHLTAQSRSIMEEFTTFVLDVAKQLKCASTDPEEIKLALETRLGKHIDERTVHRIEDATTVVTLLRIAMPFSSWYNYDLVAYLAKRYGGARGTELVVIYEKQFESHLKKLVYTCPPVLSDDLAVPQGFQELIVKVDWKYSDCTIQDVTIFKEKLCKHLNIEEPSRFILKSISEGCVRLSFILPSVMAESAWISATGAKEELITEKVISLQMEGRALNFQKEVLSTVIDSDEATAEVVSAGFTSLPTPEHTQRLLAYLSGDRLSPCHPSDRPPLSPLATHAMKAGHRSPDVSPSTTRKQRTELEFRFSPESSPQFGRRLHSGSPLEIRTSVAEELPHPDAPSPTSSAQEVVLRR